MRDMAAHAAAGRLALQHCSACGKTQYPPRELCAACLGATLQWEISDTADGEVLAVTTLHHSHEPGFRDTLPLHVGLVRFDCGPTAVCFLAAGCNAGMRVRITAHTDTEGRAVLTAEPAS